MKYTAMDDYMYGITDQMLNGMRKGSMECYSNDDTFKADIDSILKEQIICFYINLSLPKVGGKSGISLYNILKTN